MKKRMCKTLMALAFLQGVYSGMPVENAAVVIATGLVVIVSSVRGLRDGSVE